VTGKIESLLGFQKDNEDDPFLIYALAMEYAKINETGLAEKNYQLLIDKHPNYIGTYLHYAALLELLEKYDKANEIYKTGLDKLKELNDGHAWSELANAYETFKLNKNH